jgi:hypothetical protein
VIAIAIRESGNIRADDGFSRERRIAMSKFREKAQGTTKQIVGEMIGDNQLIQEGKEQKQKAEDKPKPAEGHADRSSPPQ